MFLVSSYRIIKFAWQSFWRNIWLSIVTITVIILTFVSINFLIVLHIVSNSIIDSVEERINVSIFFKPEIKEAEVLEVNAYLETLSQIDSIEYISAEQALDKFKKMHQDDPSILESLEELDDNPLGATLNVNAMSLEDYPSILEVIDNSKYKDWIATKNFDDHRDYINRINSISTNIQNIGFAITGLFIFIAILIVINTIRIAIYTHRNEIAVMKLVGATNNFIRSPFIFEAVIDGMILFSLIYQQISLVLT